MPEPRSKSRIYDSCCGSGGMFVQSEKFVEAHGGKRKDISFYGQELNHTPWRLCRTNLTIRGIEANVLEGDSTRPCSRLPRLPLVRPRSLRLDELQRLGGRFLHFRILVPGHRLQDRDGRPCLGREPT